MRRADQRARLSILEDSSALRWRHGERLDGVLEDACRRFAERAAVSVAGITVTYAELNARADQMARFFLAKGVRAGDRVGVLLDRGAEAYVALFALLKIRASYVPLDPNHPAERVRYILADAGVKLVVAHMRLADRFEDLDVTRITLDRARAEVAGCSDAPLRDDERGETDERLCYVLYTSGTTGHPKGVAIAHPSICNYVRVAAELYGLGPEDRMYQGMSLAFDFSVDEIWVSFVAGATLVPNLSPSSLFGEELGDFLAANAVTCLGCVPTLLASLERDLPSLRILIVGGEAFPPALVRRWAQPGRAVFNTYGPTETTVSATFSRVSAEIPVTIGKPLPTYGVVILDPERDEAVPWGEAGEIGIAGIAVAEGYLNRRDLTDAKFVPDFHGFANNLSGRIYRSGDLGRLTSDGDIEYLGRIDTQVKLRGYRIELAEIESVLLEIEEISQAVVTVHEFGPGVHELVAYYAVKHGKKGPAVDEIAAKLRERLPAYMTPAYLEALPFIPTLVSTKADRSKLPAPKSPRLSLGALHVPAETATECLLSQALGETLGLRKVSVEADFFNDYGAHSLVMARFCAKVRHLEPRTSVAMRDVYAYRTVRRLAAALDAANPAARALRAYGPAHAPTTFAYVACGAAQGTVYLASAAALVGFVIAAGRWTEPVADDPTALALRCAVLVAGAFIALNGFSAAGKWALIGNSRPVSIPLWSAAYFRFWLAKRLVDMAPARAFAGTPIYSLFLTALGARVGRHAMVHALAVPVAAHRFSVGAHAVVNASATMQGYVTVGNRLHFGDIRLGNHAFVGEGSVLDIDTAIGDFGQLGHASSLQSGQRVADGKRYAGSPAEETASNFVLVDEFGCSSTRRFVSSAIQLAVALLVMTGVVMAAVVGAGAVGAEAARGGTTLGEEAVAAATTAFWWSAALALGGLAIGAALVGLVSRLANAFLKPGKIYPLFGVHHSLQQIVQSASNSPFFNLLFGDSVAIERYLRFVGWRIAKGGSAGSNFGTTQTHENPFLCAIGRGTIASDGLHMLNVTRSSHAFRLDECRIGADNFLGTEVYVPPGVRTGDNCLFGTKVMAPIDGPVRQNVGLLGSPAFEIPRSSKRDADALARALTDVSADERRRRLARKNRHNLVSGLTLLGTRWFIEFATIFISVVAERAFGATNVAAMTGALLASGFATLAILIGVERASVGFSRFKPQFATVYDASFWRIERFWKLSGVASSTLFAGTPFRSWLLRAVGARVGRKVFDDGSVMTEPTLVALGDGANVNASCTLQSHSLEDGVFKSDHIRVGADVSIGVGAFVHYGVTMHDGAILDADAFLMKGEIAPAGSRWRGNPAHMVEAAAAAPSFALAAE